MLCAHAGSDRISGSRQNGDAGNSAHPTEGLIGDGAAGWSAAGMLGLAPGMLGLGAGITSGGELLVGAGLAQADPASSVDVAIVASAMALGMIFIGISPVSSATHRRTSEANFGGDAPEWSANATGNDFRVRLREAVEAIFLAGTATGCSTSFTTTSGPLDPAISTRDVS